MGSDRPLRVLCYAAVDCSHPGGVQRMVTGLSRALEEAGNTVATVWSEPAQGHVEGRTVCQLYARTLASPPYVPRRRSHLPSLLRAARLLAGFRPDVVNVHFATRAAHSFAALRSLFGYRLVLSLHGSDMLAPWPADASHVSRLLREADGITAVSGAVRDAAKKSANLSEAAVRVIANGVDTRFWSPGESRARSPNLVSVGRLEAVKGYDLLIDAVYRLHRRGMPVGLTLIGSGSQEPLLRGQAERLGLGGHVRFAGSLDPDAVREQLRESGVFVLSSRSEGMPLALMEAMACAVPCVATRVGGIPEFAQGVVPLVEPGNPEALAQTIALLLADPLRGQELGEAGRRKVMGHSIEATNRAYLTYLREISR
ncbi:MAG: glycosyltransferase family 4 protein [Sphingomonadaceae bacterium]